MSPVQTVEEFVQDAFVPHVSALSSPEAERVCAKNNLRFCELLRPFCRLTSEGHVRDPNNQLHPVKNLRINVSDVAASAASMASTASVARRLDRAVRRAQPADGSAHYLTAGQYQLSYSGATPWFSAYREDFLFLLPPSDHDFLQHHLACLLVASSSDLDPVQVLQDLSQDQHRLQHRAERPRPRWFSPNTLKFYVLLHDAAQGAEPRAEAVLEDMKQRYGANCCHLLKINSKMADKMADDTIPDPWSQFLVRRSQDPEEEDAPSAGAEDDDDVDGPPGSPGAPTGPEVRHGTCLSLEDHERIRVFVTEFTFRALLPHMEKNIRQLNDQLLSRKGLSRSLFTATRKWFGGGKLPEKSGAEPRSGCGVFYPPEAPELQIRKMADLCFLVQHYELAYQCYHTAKKDFLSDQAMLYAAGALEMAALAAFLQPGAARPYPAHYMDTAIQTYRDVCRNAALAERCALLSADILKSQGKFADAAALLIKTTSEDSDLSSALLLEQAALCFVSMKTPMVRKFSFHLVLAGHRYSKAGQRRHALRCYQQALQAYAGRGWALAEDHVHFTLGRQSFTLGRRGDAAAAFRALLGAGRHGDGGGQTAAQQAAFLREFLFVHQEATPPEEAPLPLLPLPRIDAAAVRVSFGPERRPAKGESLDQDLDKDLDLDHQQAAMWAELEVQLVAAAHGGAGLPASFRPTLTLMDRSTDNQLAPLAVVNEPVVVELLFRNPLKVPLALADLSLLWTFQDDDPNAQKEKDSVTPEILRELTLSPEETKTARLRLLPCRTGQMKISGVSYQLAAAPCAEVAPAALALAVRGRQELAVRGPRLNASKEDKMAVRHGADRRLEPRVMAAMPLLEVHFLDFPSALLCGERRGALVEFINVSAVALCGLRVASSHRDFLSFGDAEPLLVPIPDGRLHPREAVTLPVWLRGPEQEGLHQIHFLFLYQSPAHRHRVLRHTALVCASRSLSVTACRATAGRLVFVDVENMAAGDGVPPRFQISEVTGRGRRWKLGPRIGPAPDFQLSPGEQAKLCFRAVPAEPEDQDGLGAGPGPDDLDLTISVVWKTVLTEPNGDEQEAEGRVDVDLRTDGNKSKVPESLRFRSELLLLQAPPPTEPGPDGTLIQTELDYQQSLTHCFQEYSVCVVPVRLTVSSISSDPLDVDVDLRSHSGSFSWVGRSLLVLRLGPGQVRSVALRAAFLRSGVYNLTPPAVTVRHVGPAPRHALRQATPPPALILIASA